MLPGFAARLAGVVGADPGNVALIDGGLPELVNTSDSGPVALFERGDRGALSDDAMPDDVSLFGETWPFGQAGSVGDVPGLPLFFGEGLGPAVVGHHTRRAGVLVG